MADNTTRVKYQAVADFSAIRKSALEAKRALAGLRAEEKALNSASAASATRSVKASQSRTKALTGELKALRAAKREAKLYGDAQSKITASIMATTRAIQAQNRVLSTNAERFRTAKVSAQEYRDKQNTVETAVKRASVAIRSNTEATNNNARAQDRASTNVEKSATAYQGAAHATRNYTRRLGESNSVVKETNDGLKKITRNSKKAANAVRDKQKSVRGLRKDMQNLGPVLGTIVHGTRRLQQGFHKLNNWRPRLTPPFIALIPIIGGALSALTPFVAMLGSVTPVALGLASSIGSLSGAFLALPGILSGVVSGIGSVIASMGGVGNVFKTYAAMQKASGQVNKGARGQSAEERAEALARAERGLGRAQRSVQRAQENLNKARERALQNLIDLREEVSKSSLTEERAVVNLQKAHEDYWAVMAEPGSTLGDKMDAALRIKEAEAELEDVRKRNIDVSKELKEAEAKGVDQADDVVDAQDSLQDALDNVYDAQKQLTKQQNGEAIPGMQALTDATDEYEEALAKLSPSARTVVLALIGMKDQWASFRSEMQETFFSQFVEDVDKLPGMIGTLTTFLKPASAAMGDFVSNLITLLDSPAWRRDLKTIGESNGVVIEKLGDAFLNLMDTFKDIMVAAKPFTEWMVGGFADATERFSEFVSVSRDNGSLAGWLDKVRVRLQKWGITIKNIGETLFNYSAAASGFGDWMLDGFVELTEGWSEASRKAREEGSPFQEYLEDVKPLVLEIRGLFGDLFGWIREEMMDKSNIQGAVDLIQVIRQDLGPSLAAFFDQFKDAKIDEKLVGAISSIIDAITAILDAGAISAFEAFADTVSWFFKGIADILKAFPTDSLAPLASFIGVIVGLSFVGKFTGFNSFVGGMLSLASTKYTGVNTFLKNLTSFKGMAIATAITALVGLAQWGAQAITDAMSNTLATTEEMVNKIKTASTADIFDTASRGTTQNWWGKDTDKAIANRLKDLKSSIQDVMTDTGGGLFGLGNMDIIDGDSAIIKSFENIGKALSEMPLEDAQAAMRRFKEESNLTNTEVSEMIKRSGPFKDSLTQVATELGITATESNLVKIALGEISTDKPVNELDKLKKEAESAQTNIDSLKRTIDGLGDSSQNRWQAIDNAADAFDRLETAAQEADVSLRGTSESSRDFRDAIFDAAEKNNDAALSILEDGGTIEEAMGVWDEGRTKLEEYIRKYEGDPAAAQEFIDNNLKPAEEVRTKFQELSTEMDNLDKTNIQIDVEANTDKAKTNLQDVINKVREFFGFDPITAKGGGITDIGAGGINNQARPIQRHSKDPSAGDTGGFTLSNVIQSGKDWLSGAIKTETDGALSVWDNFWKDFQDSPTKPLTGFAETFKRIMDGVTSNTITPFKENTKRSFRGINTEALIPLKTDTGNAFSWITNSVFGPFKKTAPDIETTFGNMAGGLIGKWGDIQTGFRDPANFIIDSVVNKGIGSMWNTIADKIGMGGNKLPTSSLIGEPPKRKVAPLRRAGGGVLPGYSPGRDIHKFSSPTGGELLLSGGEAVMRPEFTNAVGGPKGVDAINHAVRTGKFANGGVFGRQIGRIFNRHSSGSQRQESPDLGGDISSAMDSVFGIFSDPLGYLNETLGAKANALLANVGGGDWGRLLGAIPGKMIGGLANKVKTSTPSGSGMGANAMGWRNQWSILSSAFPWATLNSAYRPGAVTSTGSPSYHGSGRAIDTTASMEIFNWIRQRFPNSRELIYSPAGARQLRDGASHSWGEPVRSQHWDHVHWAMKNGGVIPKLYDQGGWLEHGGVAVNKTGKPEAVLTPDESRALKSALSGNFVNLPGVGNAPSLGSAFTAPTQMIDNSINIDKVEITNSVPEKPSESLPKAIRRIGYMQNVRETAARGQV